MMIRVGAPNLESAASSSPPGTSLRQEMPFSGMTSLTLLGNQTHYEYLKNIGCTPKPRTTHSWALALAASCPPRAGLFLLEDTTVDGSPDSHSSWPPCNQ